MARAPVTVIPKAPGLFFARNQDGRLNSPSNPARLGETIQILGTGLGSEIRLRAARPDLVADGTPAPSTPQALTRGAPVVTVGGQRASVRLSSLLPGSVGVWQIQATGPNGAQTGSAVPVTVRFGSITSSITVAIQ